MYKGPTDKDNSGVVGLIVRGGVGEIGMCGGMGTIVVEQQLKKDFNGRTKLFLSSSLGKFQDLF